MHATTQCPHCRRLYKVQTEFIGRGTTCKACNVRFVMYVPSPLAEKEPGDYLEGFNAVRDALAARLGPPESFIHAALPPIYLGGNAEVLVFRQFPGGVAYVTCGLTFSGQKTVDGRPRELLLCTREPWEAAPAVLSELGRYTLETALCAGHTIDFGPRQPPGCTIRGVLATRPDRPADPIRLFGKDCGVLLLVGITEREMVAIRDQRKEQEVLARLRTRGVFPFTVLDRPAVI
jgi:hypothetical protein